MTEQEYDNLPQQIKEIVDSWDDNKNLYDECARIKHELNKRGFDCEYGLDGMVYDVAPIDDFEILPDDVLLCITDCNINKGAIPLEAVMETKKRGLKKYTKKTAIF